MSTNHVETDYLIIGAGTVGLAFADTLLSETEMKNRIHFLDAGWDLVGESDNGTSDVWRMCDDGTDFPRLAWEFSTVGDLACPNGIRLKDLLYLSERWTASSPQTVGAADANGDEKVDMLDLSLVAEHWLEVN